LPKEKEEEETEKVSQGEGSRYCQRAKSIKSFELELSTTCALHQQKQALALYQLIPRLCFRSLVRVLADLTPT